MWRPSAGAFLPGVESTDRPTGRPSVVPFRSPEIKVHLFTTGHSGDAGELTAPPSHIRTAVPVAAAAAAK